MLVPIHPHSCAECSGGSCGTVKLLMHLRKVEKSLYVPASRLQDMLDVYGMLTHGMPGGIPGAIKLSSVKVT